ncbi:MAG: transglycosylase SLT domain-containing protein [Acinetobacter sp.]|nr:transglycosylase SLT domain-containing protein [Acinetobacter sp.]
MDCILHLITESLSATPQSFKSMKTLLLGCAVLALSGCTSLGMGSLEKRSAKLAQGIQKAYSVDSTTANRVAPLIIQSATQNDVDPLLMAAVIRQESSYRNYVVSSAGAVGLTQVIPRYWQQTCPGDLFQENININCGSFILAKYNQSAGSWKKALAYYNVGPTGYNTNRKMKKQGKRYAKQVKQHEKNLKSKL